MGLEEALKWIMGVGGGILAWLTLHHLEQRWKWLLELPPDEKRLLAFALAAFYALGAWAMLRLAPGYQWPTTPWLWLSAIFLVAGTAITSSQLAHNVGDVRPARFAKERAAASACGCCT